MLLLAMQGRFSHILLYFFFFFLCFPDFFDSFEFAELPVVADCQDGQ